MNKQKRTNAIILIMSITLVLAISFKVSSSYPLRNNILNISKEDGYNYNEFSIDDYYLESENALIINIKTQDTVFQKNDQEKIFPASLTKLMSALVIFDYINDVQEELVINELVYNNLLSSGASMAGLYPGECVTINDLFYAMLMPSGSEATMTLVHYVTNDEQKFVELMNQKAQQLNMTNTNFTNPLGLHDEHHYSTLHDLSLLAYELYSVRYFRDIMSTHDYQTTANEFHPDGVALHSTIFDRINGEAAHLKGGKTGFTPEAGQCLFSFGTVNHSDYIIITTQAQGNNDTKPYHIQDHFYLYQMLEKNDSASIQ